MSKERDFIDTLLLFFKPEEPYTNTKERIDDLVRLCEEKAGKEEAERVRREVFHSPSAIRFLNLLYLQY